jgi:hypothetical protein
VFSARSAVMAAHARMDRATEERCFLCGPCLDIISRTINVYSGVELVGEQSADCRSSVLGSCCCEKLGAEAWG